MRISLDRPLAGLVVAAITGRPRPWAAAARRAYLPPSLVRAPGPPEPAVDPTRLSAAAVGLVRALLSIEFSEADRVAVLDAMVASDVVAWSPTMHVTSRSALIDALRPYDDTIEDVTLTISAVDVVDAKVFIEWRLYGRFTGLCFVDDDLLIEPDGRTIGSAGVVVLTFRSDQAAEIRFYYDDFAVLEQMLTPP